MASISEFVIDFLQQHSGVKRWVVALSGGLDSMVLLHSLVVARQSMPEPLTILAVHVNHNLSVNAEHWLRHCENYCASYDVDFSALSVEVRPENGGLEQAARQARYAAIADLLLAGDALLTAHHSNDQAETLLLRLARGTGLKGLVGIRQAQTFEPAVLLRPLLSFNREQLMAYAEEQQLTWVEDESNQDQRFDRNFVRAQILPLLQQRWPSFIQSASRCAALIAESDELLDAYGREDLQNLSPRVEFFGQSLALEPWLALGRARRNHVLRLWLLEQGYLAPAHQQFIQLEGFLDAASDQQPRLLWGAAELRRFAGRLYCLDAKSLQLACSRLEDCNTGVVPQLLALNQILRQPWPEVRTNVDWPFGGIICLASSAGVESLNEVSQMPSLKPLEYQLCLRSSLAEQNPKLKPHGRRHSQSLKKLLLEYGVPPWLRDKLPLLVHNQRIAAVLGFWVETEFVQECEQDQAKLETAENRQGSGLHLNWLPSRSSKF